VASYDVSKLVASVKAIGGVSWVLINLSECAAGDLYLAPHSVLTSLTPRATPNHNRDLFGELLDGFGAAGIKVIAYIATEGPAKLKHGACKAFDKKRSSTGQCSSAAMDNWAYYVENTYGNTTQDTYKQAFAEVIIKEYADRYGTKLSGWWFDHANYGNIPLLHQVIKNATANPDTVVAFNDGQKSPLINNNPGFEDFTAGHPNPVVSTPASSDANLPMLTSIEGTLDGYIVGSNGIKSLGHMYMPVQTKWYSGTIVWTPEKAASWMHRALAAHGAFTWSILANDAQSELRSESVDWLHQMLNVTQLLI